jgi:glycosyltransferase involved in cell wall biosynthesis
MPKRNARYLLISPVKDEERFVEHTLRSVVRQTVQPCRWVIVDDASSDRTPEIVSRYAKDYDFIKMVRTDRGGERQPGSAVIRAFYRGVEAAQGLDYDYIVKLDCDLSFDSDYFEKLIGRFEENEKLGIASGIYYEERPGGSWEEVKMPPYHAAGASKMMRKECFVAVGGFVPARGWDTVDEIRAVSQGWRTTHFSDLKMKHWKVEGSGIGQWRTSLMHGEIYYLTGGGRLFFLMKALHRMTRPPYVTGAVGLVWGYLRTALKRTKLLVTQDEARCYRRLLNSRFSVRTRQTLQFGRSNVS